MTTKQPRMSQTDIERHEQLEKLPTAIHHQAHAAHRAADCLARVRGGRESADAQLPDFVTPTALQRVGHYMRLAIYPANVLAEMTAGAATAMYLARALLNVPDRHLWMAPVVFALVVLALEIFVAHARESGRDALGRASLSWTGLAVVIVLVLVGLQATSQLAEAMTPLVAGGAVRNLAHLTWVEWGRVSFACIVLGSLHVAVLFGGSASESAIAYLVFRSNRRVTGMREWWHASAERTEMSNFAQLVTAYHTNREAHIARGFDAGKPAAFDGITRTMLERLAQRPSANLDASGNPTPTPASAGSPAIESERRSAGDPHVTPVDAAAEAQPIATGLEGENDYLRSVLDARLRSEDGEVRRAAR